MDGAEILGLPAGNDNGADDFPGSELGSTSDSSQQQQENIIRLEDLKRTRSVVLQALVYVIAFVFTWVFLVADMVARTLKLIFLPSQGLWNMLIFMYHKAYLLFQTDRCDSIVGALKIILARSHEEEVPPMLLSNVELVRWEDSLHQDAAHQQTSSSQSDNDDSLAARGPVGCSPRPEVGSEYDISYQSQSADLSGYLSSTGMPSDADKISDQFDNNLKQKENWYKYPCTENF